jgi:hypothetical protein
MHNYTDLPKITLEQVQHFFEHYKDLEPGKRVKTQDWGDAEEARRVIRAATRARARLRSPVGWAEAKPQTQHRECADHVTISQSHHLGRTYAGFLRLALALRGSTRRTSPQLGIAPGAYSP